MGSKLLFMSSLRLGRVCMARMKDWVGIDGGKLRQNVLCVGISVIIVGAWSIAVKLWKQNYYYYYLSISYVFYSM